MIRTHLGRALTGLAAAAGLVIGLGACSALPGVALRVGDSTYTEAQVTTTADQVKQMFGSDVTRQNLVWSLIQAKAVEDVGAAHKVVVDDAAVQDQIAAAVKAKSITWAPQDPSPALMDLLRTQIIANQLEGAGIDTATLSKDLATAMAGEQVDMSPRYGAYDPVKGAKAATLGDVVASAGMSGTSGSGTTGGSESGTQSGTESGNQSGN